MNEPENYLRDVRDHYEDYPYPKRAPEDERHRLCATATDALDWINYYCFEGKQDYADNFRVLVAGGGTGDALIFLAAQLREYNAEIVYLDISRASSDIAQQRARIRGLSNITWINGSILDLPALQTGMFDYINCSGVLHHLEDPDLGLARLRDVLKDEGAMTVMVYATYGRTGIYHIQEIMRRVNGDTVSRQEKVDNCKRVLAQLPPTNWFIANKGLYEAEITEFGDIGIYDLFLHSQDRAYTVPELYKFIEGAGLNIIHLFASHEPRGNLLYDPASYVSDPVIRERLGNLPLREQQTVAELLHGRINKHTLYATPTARKRPVIDDLDNVPGLSIGFGQQAYSGLYELARQSQQTIEVRPDQNSNKVIRFGKSPYTEDLFRHLDGKRSLREIFDAVRRDHPDRPSDKILLQEFRHIFNALSIHNWMLLRDRSIKPFTDIHTLQQRVAG